MTMFFVNYLDWKGRQMGRVEIVSVCTSKDDYPSSIVDQITSDHADTPSCKYIHISTH